ncbi:MAG: nitroreductase family protein, partial [Ruminococcus sp.]|nr:nitroreductase family protein [Ruminococcus sp.]
MNTLDAMKERRSCRNFKSDMPTKQQLETICEAGSYAATGMG